ncbi:tyrosine--tRNA ligase [Mycoplasma leonicaptivi]|uniref:tyrosine--tRNA ligase n=1 Tax=Mycoplasma leonicaptivi TaxID=36742 RepID=UPI000482BFAC|nr:tyrosine--tRNA ligase [Mycoplasma leonicaptivi]
MHIIQELKLRGLLKDISDTNKILFLPWGSKVYAGFDPTAESLHLGNYIIIATLLRFKKYGFNPVALIGGATGMIGDPSFKDSERQLLDNQTVIKNKNKIREQLENFGLEVIDNYDFYKNMSVLEFLRDAGKLVNISYMLSKDSVSSRIEKGLSFTEFSYQLIQGWDFYKLYKEHEVKIQVGGSDQWGNLTTGLQIINKQVGEQHNASAITISLLTDSNGNKFGKSTGGGNLWLNSRPYDLYQFLLNQNDSEIDKLFKFLTFLELDEIQEIVQKHQLQPSLKLGQERLAYEVIRDIFGENEAIKSKTISELLFNKNIDLSSISVQKIESIEGQIPTVQLNKNQNLVNQLIELKIINSKREVRELIQKNAFKVNLKAITEDFVVKSEYFDNKFALLHLGKKKVFLVKIV